MVLKDIGLLAYGTLNSEQTIEVVETYRRRQNIEHTSDELSFPYAPASVARLINWAVTAGLLSEAEKMPIGGRPRRRERAMDALRRHPLASPPAIARLAGCSETTVYRAKNQLE